MNTITADPITVPLVEVPVETAKPLKLSEALRLGAMGTKQSYGSWHDTDAEGNDMMCALSTAWYALTGHKGNDASGSPLADLLSDKQVRHPVEGGHSDIMSVVINLNDTHRWTRPAIADWLESIGL